MGRVQSKVAVITGGSTGLGKAACQLFATEGARVVIADIQDDLGAAVAEEINASGGTAHYYHMDVTSEADVDGGLRRCLRQAGEHRHPGEQRRDHGRTRSLPTRSQSRSGTRS